MSQVSFRFRSFLFGMTVASLTWGASIYLYMNLNSSSGSGNTGLALRHNGNSLSDDPSSGSRHVIPKSPGYSSLHDLSGRNLKNLKKEINESSRSNGEWKLKFKQIIDDGTMYRNSDTVLSKLRSKVKVINGHGPFREKGSLDHQDPDVNLGLIKSIQEKKIHEEGFKKHAFNTLVSSRLSYHRNIPDTRNDRCSSLEYPTKLPSASIIICFYNEELNVLFRTVHSVLGRSNAQNLHEILLVDDFSDIEGLHEDVQNYTKHNFPMNKVKLLKTPKREGLIRARIFGAKAATGHVLVFLDSHVEANVNWLDPLLARVAANRTTVATPMIDIINPDTFVYSPSPIVKGGFNWGLHFRWDNVPKEMLLHGEDFVKPITSPTMAGGLFAMSKSYFHELGDYDEGMDIWGGENIELSFRVWTCGGRIEVVPCSRVGHVFRRRRPYGSPGGEDTALKNSIRVAEVWLDEFKEEYYKGKPGARGHEYGDISSRVELRKRLECKPFKWYVENIYPQILDESSGENKNVNKTGAKRQAQALSPWNLRKRTYVSKFQINLAGTKLCLEAQKTVFTKNSGLILAICQSWNKKQKWLETEKHELVLAEVLCLDATNNKLRLAKCHEMLGSQEWRRISKTGTAIYNVAAGMCIGFPETLKKPVAETPVSLEICSEDRPFLKFDLISYSDM